MNILVTGGAGFIASHIADAYLALGHRVIVLDNLSSGKKENIHPDAVFYEGDLMDESLLKEIFDKEKIQIVNHHAAQISVTRSVDTPHFDAEINIFGTLNLLQLAKTHKISKFILASTGGAIYGEQDFFPASEDHPCRPISPYGISKFSAENYLRFYRETFGLKSSVFRYSNVYGPRQDPHGEAGVVAILCKKLIAGETPVIYGDGEQTRDFVCALDVVKANVLGLQESCQGIFNVSTGTETTINHLADLITKVSGQNISAKHEDPRKGEQRRSSVDFSKINKELGWKPDLTLEQGLVKTFEFFSEKATREKVAAN